MSKKQLRDLFYSILKRLTKGWNLLVTGVWSAIIWLAAVTHEEVGGLLFLILIMLLVVGVLYAIAKGK